MKKQSCWLSADSFWKTIFDWFSADIWAESISMLLREPRKLPRMIVREIIPSVRPRQIWRRRCRSCIARSGFESASSVPPWRWRRHCNHTYPQKWKKTKILLKSFLSSDRLNSLTSCPWLIDPRDAGRLWICLRSCTQPRDKGPSSPWLIWKREKRWFLNGQARNSPLLPGVFVSLYFEGKYPTSSRLELPHVALLLFPFSGSALAVE